MMIEKGEESVECCMCGDSGLSHELFRCKTCRFRSQHRYCSNIYPKADSYDVCNWCLSQTTDAKETSRDSSDTTSLIRSLCSDVKRQKRASADDDELRVNGVVKKQGLSKTRKRIMTKGQLEEIIKLRRAKSEDKSSNRSNGRVIVKHGFRTKVRYKLLDEVSN